MACFLLERLSLPQPLASPHQPLLDLPPKIYKNTSLSKLAICAFCKNLAASYTCRWQFVSFLIFSSGCDLGFDFCSSRSAEERNGYSEISNWSFRRSIHFNNNRFSLYSRLKLCGGRPEGQLIIKHEKWRHVRDEPASELFSIVRYFLLRPNGHSFFISDHTSLLSKKCSLLSSIRPHLINPRRNQM